MVSILKYLLLIMLAQQKSLPSLGGWGVHVCLGVTAGLNLEI